MSSKFMANTASTYLLRQVPYVGAQLNPYLGTASTVIAGIGAIMGVAENIRRLRREEEKKVPATRGIQPLSMFEEQKQMGQQMRPPPRGFEEMNRVIESIENVSIPSRSIDDNLFAVETRSEGFNPFQQLFNINIEEIVYGRAEIPPYLQILLNTIREQIFRDPQSREFVGLHADQFNLLILVFVFGEMPLNEGFGEIYVRLNTGVYSILSQFKRFFQNKTKEVGGETEQQKARRLMLQKLREMFGSRLDTTKAGLDRCGQIMAIAIERLQQEENRQNTRATQLFDRNLSQTSILLGLRLQMSIVAYGNTYRSVYDRLFGNLEDQQYSSRFYAFQFNLALLQEVEGFPSLSRYITPSQLRLIVDELHDLYTNREIPNVALRLQAMPLVQELTFGSVVDINQSLGIYQRAGNQDFNPDLTNPIITYVVAQMENAGDIEGQYVQQDIDQILANINVEFSDASIVEAVDNAIPERILDQAHQNFIERPENRQDPPSLNDYKDDVKGDMVDAVRISLGLPPQRQQEQSTLQGTTMEETKTSLEQTAVTAQGFSRNIEIEDEEKVSDEDQNNPQRGVSNIIKNQSANRNTLTITRSQSHQVHFYQHLVDTNMVQTTPEGEQEISQFEQNLARFQRQRRELERQIGVQPQVRSVGVQQSGMALGLQDYVQRQREINARQEGQQRQARDNQIIQEYQVQQAGVLRDMVANQVRHQVNVRLERQLRVQMGLNLSFLGLQGIELFQNEQLKKMLRTIQDLLEKLLKGSKTTVTPPPPDDVIIDGDGDLIIKKKRMQELPPATFVLKKELEIKRRELDDMTPIERVLAPEGQKRRGRPRKQIPPMNQLSNSENAEERGTNE